MKSKASNRWAFDFDNLTAPYVLIILAILGLVFVLGLLVSHEVFAKWGALAIFTMGIFGFFISDSREHVKVHKFWALVAILLALHLTGWIIFLRQVGEWRPIWFSVMVLEFPVFSHLRDRPGLLN
jgi:hypothetical protein